jgi:hypothetical protein
VNNDHTFHVDGRHLGAAVPQEVTSMPRQALLDPKKTAWTLIVAAGMIGVRLVAQQAGPPAGDGAPPPPVVRTDISGDWTYANSEDQPHRVPGPELGDYTGLPLNNADRQKADAWDATILSQPERQAQPHPAQYLMRGPGPALRIVKILDPITQELVAYAMAGGFGRADRVIWMDGRPHPSDFSEHTWDGFSTGVWENGQLVVTTTHMKMGVIQRNGSAASPYGKMVEHFFRHGDLLAMFSRIDDPIYFEEPMVRSQTWRWNPNGNAALGNAFESVDELGDKPPGWVPFYPLGVTHSEFAQKVGLPFGATRGGKESLYPEYQLKVQEMIKEDAARKAADAVKSSPGDAAPKK